MPTNVKRGQYIYILISLVIIILFFNSIIMLLMPANEETLKAKIYTKMMQDRGKSNEAVETNP